MKEMTTWLCRYSMVTLIVLHAVALAQSSPPISFSQLRAQAIQHGLVSGWFVQCTTYGSANIVSSGRFTFQTGKRLNLNFSSPNRYSIEFLSDGTQRKTVGGLEQKVARHSPLGSLLLPMLSMQESSVKHHFEIELIGTIAQFKIRLSPKKRMLKILHSVEITGAHGMVERLRMTARDNRIVSIRLFLTDPTGNLVCE